MQAMPPRRDQSKPKFIVLKVTRDLQSNTWEAVPQTHKSKAQSGGLVDTDPWQTTERSEKLLETKFVFSYCEKSTSDFSLLLCVEKIEPLTEHYQYSQDLVIPKWSFLAS